MNADRARGAHPPCGSSPAPVPSGGAVRTGGEGTAYRVRRVRADDAEAVLDAFGSAADMARQGEVDDRASADRYVAWLTEDHRRAFAIVQTDDRLVGLVGVSIDEVNRSGWLFYWMHGAHRGRGATSRAVASVADLMLAAAPEGEGLERLELGHRVNNPASGAVARAAGFVPEGREREKFLIDGVRIDVLTYGRLRDDPVPGGERLRVEAVAD